MNVPTGFLLIDKERGWTSHDVVAKVRGMLGFRKIGHAGTLDPMATGLLVLGLGRATRLLRFITDQPKEYVAVAGMGIATDTLDADGVEVHRQAMSVGPEEVATVMAGFIGEQQQTPPMVSALKVGGKRLHDLARQGKEVERPARTVTVDHLVLETFEPGPFPKIGFRVVGGKGLYVRVLADDIARVLGGRAHLTALRRIRTGPLRVEDARRIDALDSLASQGASGEVLLSPSEGLRHLPAIEVSGPLVKAVSNGRPLPTDIFPEPVAEGPLRLTASGRMLAIYRSDVDRLVPQVVLA